MVDDNDFKYEVPKTEEEINNMYKIAFYIGKFLLYNFSQRYSSFREWIKKAKEGHLPIRNVYNNQIYDFEIKLNNGKWMRIGDLTSKALKEELSNAKKRR